MSVRLNRALYKVSDLRVEIGKAELQMECLQDLLKQKKEEAQSLENDILFLQGKLQGIRELESMFREELRKQTTRAFELRKRAEKEEPVLALDIPALPEAN